MSKLRITTLATQDDTYSVPAETLARGACRAWVNFDGTTAPPTIRASFNVSSVGRNSTGDYTINFTNAMPDAEYSFICSTRANRVFGRNPDGTNNSGSLTLVITGNGESVTRYNETHASVAIFR